MKIISIVNVKGGVGKTLVTLNLASALSSKGYRILLIDNDPQSSLTNILRKSHNDLEVPNLYDLYTNKNCTIKSIITKYKENIDVLYNSIDAMKVESELSNKVFRESILKSKLESIDNYDFALIDNSPYLGLAFKNSIATSNYYLTVIDNSKSAVQGLSYVDDIVNEIVDCKLNSNLKLLGILRNRFDKRTNYTKVLNDYLNNRLDDTLFETIIFDSVKYREATLNGKLIHDYDKTYAEPFDNLAEEIITKINREELQ